MALVLVTATRLTQSAFTTNTLLGRSLSAMAQVTQLAVRGYFENSQSLGACYNEAIDAAASDDVLIFIHDDVWIDDWMAGWRVQEALDHFDVVGVVGNRRRQKRQETWYLKPGEVVSDEWKPNGFDHEWLSGLICHGTPDKRSVSNYGPVPQPVHLLDGVFMAAKAGTLQKAGVRFDADLGFHLYDLDFCRSAITKGLSLGTWPIAITHQSGGGSIQSAAWRKSLSHYFEKWRD